ncbi:serine/threonine protein kinase [Haloarcula onubensis]|uniref:non-specific serine/threonine protein kinase n=1 Tax=Haloarcula onubensis TaxID=2950539 RepID=A0ABU2FS41_9EURY|nr:protein kinase [Halomicroarcula sp. S3CR25-11]MDS0283588.1 hypothetical protein [Halomicroarcula sp. S3CR25-11]
MSGPAERFEAETTEFEEVELVTAGECVHEYAGFLVETMQRVRVRTLAPELADVDTAAEAFTAVSDQWYNASANANIRAVADRGTDPRPWIAVPETDGTTLAAAQSTLSPDAVETVLTDTADALRTLGLYNTVHGYLSPADITLTGLDDATAEPSVQVGGFGLEQAVRTAVDEVEPTPYTAPELLDRDGQPNQRTDVYGLGAVAYFALTGRPPVDGADLAAAIRDGVQMPPSEHEDGISSALDDVVLRALSTDPADRQDSPYAFHRAFVAAFSPDQLGAPEPASETPVDAETSDAAGDTDTDPEAGSPAPGEPADGPDATETDRSGTSRRVIGLLALVAVGGVVVMGALGSGIVPLDSGGPSTDLVGEPDAQERPDATAEPTPARNGGDGTTDGGGDGTTAGDGDGDTAASVDGVNSVPGVSDGEVTNTTALLLAYSEAVFTGHTDFETTYDGNRQAFPVEPADVEQFSFRLRNDTQQQLYVEDTTESLRTYYIDGERAAILDEAAGEIRYSDGTNSVRSDANFARVFPALTLNYISLLRWETAGTATVDGEEHYVLEATGVNETALSEAGYTPSADDVTSGEGRLVVGSDGVVHDGSLRLTGDTEVSITYSLRTDDSIEVTQPDWYDESQAS